MCVGVYAGISVKFNVLLHVLLLACNICLAEAPFAAYFSVIKEIFDVVDKHIAEETLIRDLTMRSLPALSKKFIDLLELLVQDFPSLF